MARIFWRLLVCFLAFVLLLTVSRQVGAQQPGSRQLAYSYYNSTARAAVTLLFDTGSRHQVRLHSPAHSVKLIGWLSHRFLLVDLDGALAVYDARRGLSEGVTCDDAACPTAIVESGREPVGAWPGRSSQDLMPQWSPDGARIAVMRRVGNSFALLLYVVDRSGEALRVTRRGVLNLNYFWRPCEVPTC